MSEMKRILVLEDEAMVVGFIQSCFKGKGQSTVTPSAPNAIAILHKENFDGFLLDYSVIEGTGLDVLEALRQEERYRETPVVFWSGALEDDIKATAEALGATCLRKPGSQQQILAGLKLA